MKTRYRPTTAAIPVAMLVMMFFAAWLGLSQNTAVFPASVASDSDLFIANNNASSLLTAGISSGATTATVASGTGFSHPSLVSIDNEIMAVCGVSGNTLTFGRSACPNADGRGFDGTAAVSHLAGRAVQGRVVGWLHNQMAAEIKAVETALQIVPADTKYFVFDGDSRTAINGDGVGVGNEWPAKMMQMSNFNNKGTIENVATSGYTCAQLVSRYTATIHPFRPTGGQKSYYFLECGINDIATSGSSAATVEGLLASLWASANSDGFRVVAQTIFDDTALTATQEATRVAVNAWILANSPLTNFKTIDVEAIIGPGEQWHNDAPHLTAQGQYLRAAYTNAIFSYGSVSAGPVPASFFVLLSAYTGQTWNGPYGAVKTCFEDNAGGGGTGRFGCFDASGAVSFLLDGASAARFNKGISVGGAAGAASTVYSDNVGARTIWYDSGAVAQTIVSADIASQFNKGVTVGGTSGGNNTMTLDNTGGSDPRVQQNNGSGAVKTLIRANSDSYIQGGKTAIIPPTSCSGYATGTLWNNAGTLALCP